MAKAFEQLHAGKFKGVGDSVWHTYSDRKLYWCGSWHPRTPRELYLECQATMADLLKNHPELGKPDKPIDPWMTEQYTEQT